MRAFQSVARCKSWIAAGLQMPAMGLISVVLVAGSLCSAIGGSLKEVNPPASPEADNIIVIEGARLIDGRGGEPIEDSVVVVRGPKIAKANSRDEIDVPKKANHVNASGLTLVPGLIDSHFHSVNDLEIPKRFLGNGVTTFRDPGHPFRFYQAVMQTDRLMPRVFLCGAHLDGYPPIWPQQAMIIQSKQRARSVVRRHVERGASGVKIYFRLPLKFYEPICETAHELGVPVTAHLELVDADKAIRAGLNGVEHVTSFGTALADPETAKDFKEAVSNNPDARHEERYRLWAGLDLDDSPRVDPLLDLIREENIFVSPTLAVFEKQGSDPDVAEYEAKGFKKMLRFVVMCHDQGISVVTGSHTWVPYADTGWAFQRELELLVKAGLSPMDAIQAGTINNARFFRSEDRLGTIESQKLADMVLVKGDPSKDITAMRNIERVMLNGHWVDRSE